MYDGWDKAFDYFWRLIGGDWYLEHGWKLSFEEDPKELGIIIFKDPLNKEA